MQIVWIVIIAIVSFAIIADLIAAAVITIKFGRPKQRTNEHLVEYEVLQKKFDRKWLDKPFEAKWLQSKYGYKLFGRLYRNPTSTNDFILSLHGHNSSGIGQLKYLDIFLSLGYNVFIPDHRKSGLSEGKTITFGCCEKNDVISWINLLQKENPHATFGIFGESMGATTAILVTAMDTRIKFLIEYCGFATFADLVIPLAGSKLLYYFLAFALRIMFALILGANISGINARKAMRKITVPTLILHSKADKLVFVHNAYLLKEANPSAEMVLFEDSPHARSIVCYKELYKKTLKEFIIKTVQQYSGGNHDNHS